MPHDEQALVAIINNARDLKIAQNSHWYRIPIGSVRKWLDNRWPPEWIAFYHTKALQPLAYGVYFYARVIDVRQVFRWQLFPDEPRDEKSTRRYYQVRFEPLRQFPAPILSRRWRRIVFIPTTAEKLFSATEINDLFDGSPLEDRLWAEFKQRQILAERQEFVKAKGKNYALDFAVYCRDGALDIETDGDYWHANPERAPVDNVRDNLLRTVGWTVLRFSTKQIQEEMTGYCVPTILDNINRLGGIDDGRLIARRFDLDTLDDLPQLGLFDDLDQE
jgi:very-short-patch-repair endonuclease